MGMFDTIVCKYKLPLPNDPKGYAGSSEFQTKDLHCVLDIYLIDENGQLFVQRRESEWIEGNPKGKSFLEKTGHIKTIRTWLESVNDTCTIEFYDYQHSNNTECDYSITYEAIFDCGKIKSVELIGFEAWSNSERKRKDVEFKEKLRKWDEFRKTRRYKYLLNPYNKCLKFICDFLYKNFNFIATSIRKMHNFLMIK